MNARGSAYALQDYSRAIEQAALVIEALREPVASSPPPAQQDWYARWARIPMFLLIRAQLPTR